MLQGKLNNNDLFFEKSIDKYFMWKYSEVDFTLFGVSQTFYSLNGSF